MPDFGYEGDNFMIQREDSPKNWRLLAEIISNKKKHEWLKNHITLRNIRKKQEEEDRKKQLAKNLKMQ